MPKAPKSSSFRFRRFTIQQDRCAMKVGTDGVLLGAWAAGGRRILDIGTGTGVVALMLAQRFPQAQVTAVELDPAAARQAAENAAASPFAERVQVVAADARDFSGTFSAIVCNPPYYEHTLPARDAQRDMARSAQTLTFAGLMAAARRLLAPAGTLSIVAPASAAAAIEAEAALRALYIKERARVRTVERKPPKRVLLAFSPTRPATLADSEVTLQAPDGSRSEWYDELTRDFYL